MSVFTLLSTFLLSSEPADTIDKLPVESFLETVRIIHHPEEIMFQGRVYDLELFVHFPEDSLESVSLFIRTDTTSRYQEIPMKLNRGRYSVRYDPAVFPGLLLQYFFVVRLKNYSIFATPINNNGVIQPVIHKLINPVEYYKKEF